MKTLKYLWLLITGVILTSGAFAQSQQLTVPLTNPGKPFKLNVNLISGSISITGYEGRDIIINAHGKDDKKEDRDTKTGMRRIGNGGRMEINAQENANQIDVSSGLINKQVDLIIKVPMSNGTFKIATVNDGNIAISNAGGGFEVINVNGYIHMNGISGSVVANTVNGGVKVGFKNIDPKAAMAFSTLNGDVDVTFPAGFRANVKLKSDRGEIFTDFNMVADNRQPSVRKTVNNGLYNIKINEWVYGKIEGGGPEILMKNMNGNIYLRKAK